jgi:hypothetical protein
VPKGDHIRVTQMTDRAILVDEDAMKLIYIDHQLTRWFIIEKLRSGPQRIENPQFKLENHYLTS